MLLEHAVIVITGARGVGKTTLACLYAPPDEMHKVFYHGAERSANRVYQELKRLGKPFGHYSELSTRFADLPAEDDLLTRLNKGELPWRDNKQKDTLEALFEYILDDLDKNLTKGAYEVYIHDTVNMLESAMVAWADSHTKELGVKGGVRGSAWGEFWTKGYYVLYDQLFEAIFSRGVQTIILTTHLKDATDGKKKIPGKVIPGGKPWLTKQISLALWLVNDWRNPGGEPAALVLKERLGGLSIVDGLWKPLRALPRRIPVCTWPEIERYMQAGYSPALASSLETPNKAEEEMISELLTDEQMRLMVLDAEADRLQKEIEVASYQQSVSVDPTAMVRDSSRDRIDQAKQAARDLGLTGENASEVRTQLIATWPAPLQSTPHCIHVVDTAIEEVLSE